MSHSTALTPDLRAIGTQASAHAPASTVQVVLQLGETQSTLAVFKGAEVARTWTLALGLQDLAHRLMPAGRLDPLAIEAGIAEVEDLVMPLHRELPTSAQLFTADSAAAEVAHWAGRPDDASVWWFSTEAVEHLFNRWVALALGRPASQDDLPTTGRFSAALLVVREVLHHLGFEGITLLYTPNLDQHTKDLP